MDNPINKSPQHGFSVGTLLLLTAVVAIGLAATQNAWLQAVKLDHTQPLSSFFASVRSQFQQYSAVMALRCLAGAMIGLFVGIGIGATRTRPVASILLAIPVGSVAGACAGALITERANFPLVAIGSGLLVLLGAVVWTFSRQPK